MTHREPNLQTTQKLLWKLITAPNGVHQALKASPRTQLPIKKSQTLTPAERLDIYANMYFYRILDSLKEDYPAVLKVIGEKAFHNLITDYLIKHPPHHFSMRNVGKKLPEFLKKHPLNRPYPYSSELARLEWALIEIFDAPDSPILTQATLQRIAPESWASLTFSLIPAFNLIRFSWDIARQHSQAIRGKKCTSVSSKTQWLRTWRRDMKVYYQTVPPLEQKVLQSLQKGLSFGDLCALTAKKIGMSQAVPTMAKMLLTWIQEGLFRELKK